MAGPAVSVIIAAYNAMPYLTRCLTSVLEQSIGLEALEVIAVNDGSTDGTARELDRFAALHPGVVRVLHQENSGGPSGPRNAGLDQARGTYVFFLDADDHLAPEALERMVAMAEENGTDVVLGKMVGVGGRAAPTTMFRRDQPKTDVFSSRVYWTLNPMKLFRRELVERLGLRFPTDLKVGEDQLFVGLAYLHAAGISVLASYDCMYWVLREDEGNMTLSAGGTEPLLQFLPRVVDMILDNVPPGSGRDELTLRHLNVDVQQLLADRLVHEPRPQQEKALDRLAEIIAPLWHEGLNDRLPAMARLRLHLVRHRMLDELLEVLRYDQELSRSGTAAPVVVDDGRAYARYPYFRDPAHPVPDHCYDVTAQLGTRHHVTRADLRGSALHLAGHAHLHRVGTRDVTTELVLRERASGTEYRLPVTSTATPGLGAEEDEGRYAYDRAGFEAVVDIATAADGAPLADGLWDISLMIGAQGITREVRIGSKRSADVISGSVTLLVDVAEDIRAVTLYTTKPYGNLTLDLGERLHKVAPRLAVDAARWASDAPTELEFTGRCTLAAYPEGALVVRMEHEGGATALFPARRPAQGDGFVVRVPVDALAEGVWRGGLRLAGRSVPLPELPARLPAAKWRRRGRPWYAKPAPERGAFALQVARTDLLRALGRRIKG